MASKQTLFSLLRNRITGASVAPKTVALQNACDGSHSFEEVLKSLTVKRAELETRWKEAFEDVEQWGRGLMALQRMLEKTVSAAGKKGTQRRLERALASAKRSERVLNVYDQNLAVIEELIDETKRAIAMPIDVTAEQIDTIFAEYEGVADDWVEMTDAVRQGPEMGIAESEVEPRPLSDLLSEAQQFTGQQLPAQSLERTGRASQHIAVSTTEEE